MNQLLDTRGKKMLFAFVGFGVPALFLFLQVFFSVGTVPLMILMMTWFGFALLMYLGLTEDDAPQ